MNRIILLIPFFIFLTGCFPVYKTQKPQLTVNVVNERGVAIPNVKVVLVTSVRPAKIDDQYDEKYSNQIGVVNFEKQAQWKVESLMIHGVQFYDWHLCVAKEGYITQDFIDVTKNEQIKIILKQGNTPPRQYAYQC
ncbi:hypothetical protein KTH93_19215 [Acinetobacter bereziniae]|uniref:hypothetical protein n=1 Tax=Acinetobacter bereziniae TaxID=106648 RepID=UPI0021D1BA0D|nr:hypothetical protein [Acinetobacter bereziniae]MCU4437588.1 hypothetical protein [Acinetobacter bereziniae]